MKTITKELSQSNNHGLLLIVITILAFHTILNYSISGMRLGLISHIVADISLAYTFIKKREECLIIFYFADILIGPFYVINLKELGFAYIGRLDYFVSIIITLAVLKKFSINRYLFYSIVVLIVALFSEFVCSNDIYLFDIYYGFICKFIFGFVLFHIYIRCMKTSFGSPILAYLLYVHLFISVFQLFVFLPIRMKSQDALLHLWGLVLPRPTGLLEYTYIYGFATMVLFFLAYSLGGIKEKKSLFFLAPIIFVLSGISNRSVLLGCVVYFLILFWSRRNIAGKAILGTLFIVVTMITIVNNPRIFLEFDRSTNIKTALWYLTMREMKEDSNVTDLAFGHGRDSAQFVASGLMPFVSSEKIDIGINTDQFLIHNIFLQTLFDFGAIFFLIYMWPIFRAFKNVFLANKFSISKLIFIIALSQYFFHNGIFAPLLFFITLVVIYEGKSSICSINRQGVLK